MFIPQYCLLFILVIECFSKKNPLRIYGGTNARERDYPYVVRMEARLIKKDVILHIHICTASAITSTWALTAAHCVQSGKVMKAVIRYGPVENSPYHEDTFSDVLLNIAHPSYSHSYGFLKDGKMKNDIGLMKTTPMKIKSFGKLSAVDYFSLYGYEAVQAGYGITTTKLSNGTILTNTTLDLLKPLQIMNVLIFNCKIKKLQPFFCLASKCEARVSVCPGDSGGPLIHPSGVVGVASLAEATGDCLLPVIKKRVPIVGLILPISPYIEWILSYVTA